MPTWHDSYLDIADECVARFRQEHPEANLEDARSIARLALSEAWQAHEDGRFEPSAVKAITRALAAILPGGPRYRPPTPVRNGKGPRGPRSGDGVPPWLWDRIEGLSLPAQQSLLARLQKYLGKD